MEFINANDLPAAGAMGTDNKVIVQQGDKFVLMTLAELLDYMASANVETDPTLTLEGVAAEALATGAAIGNLKKSGRAVNLLDNSYFANLINQRGQTYYGATSTIAYCLDRWQKDKATVVTVADGYIIVNANNNGFFQTLPEEKMREISGKVCTFAIMVKTETAGTAFRFGVGGGGGYEEYEAQTEWSVITRHFTFDYENNPTQNSFAFRAIGEIQVKWAALYVGEYTPETLPEYQPKGYAAELAECRRYYRQSWHGAIEDMTVSGSVPFIRSEGGANTQMAVNWHDPMRITPTIEIYSPSTKAKNYIRDWVGSADKPVGGAGYASPYGFCLSLKDSGTTAGKDYVFHYTASADL